MKNILTDEEKKTPMGKILLLFKYSELSKPKVREELEKKIIEQFGDEGWDMIKHLENNNLLPRNYD